MKPPITVLKLGGSVLASEDALPRAIHEIYREVREGRSVVAVVSAFRGVTDGLARRARSILPQPAPEALATLLGTGETETTAFLAFALERSGIPATVLDPERLHLLAAGDPLDADPVSVDARPIAAALADVPVAIVPGFIARDRSGRRVLLGRGGSDLTALVVGAALDRSRVRLIKDVPGLFDRDPARLGSSPRLYAFLNWDDALRLDGRIVQHKAIRFARARDLEFDVAAVNGVEATHVGRAPSRFVSAPYVAPSPLRVAVCGLGTVGLGVWQHLEASPELFAPVLAVARRYRPSLDAGVDPDRLTLDLADVLASDAEVVVDALVDAGDSASLIAAAIASGKHVVTANRVALAHFGAELRVAAHERGVRLTGSAAVGGGVPILETLRALAREGMIDSVDAVLNGTSTFVLDRIREGASLDAAVRKAQALGFAEADPTRDLDGTDAACKLALVVEEAFGVVLPQGSIPIEGIHGVLAAPQARATRHRLVARARRVAHAVEASVRPESIPDAHPLATLTGEECGAVIRVVGRREPVVLRGKGAGRYPTAEAVIGDLLEIARAVRPTPAKATREREEVA